LKIDTYMLAMMPIAYLVNQDDAFDRLREQPDEIEPVYREVINTGVLGYQLFTYQALTGSNYSQEVQRLVREYQLIVLDREHRAGDVLKKTLDLIEGALGAGTVSIPAAGGNIEVPVEMNVALALLLKEPASPDYSSNASQQIYRIGADVDWCFARYLSRGREEILRIFSPMLAQTDLDRDSAPGLL